MRNNEKVQIIMIEDILESKSKCDFSNEKSNVVDLIQILNDRKMEKALKGHYKLIKK